MSAAAPQATRIYLSSVPNRPPEDIAAYAAAIAEAGFEPVKSNLLSAPRGNPTVKKTYTHPRSGPLRVSLAFRSEGAKLGLDLVAPDGKGYHWEGEGSVILEAPYAAAGEWTATVTALQIPYENFPFSVTFGAKR